MAGPRGNRYVRVRFGTGPGDFPGAEAGFPPSAVNSDLKQADITIRERAALPRPAEPALGEQDFAIRRSQRHDVAMAARFCIAPAHAALVRLSTGSGARDGWLEAGVVDVSNGGIGLVTSVFVPRRCLITLRIRGDESPDSPTLLECVARVQRIVMTDRRPAYLLGTAFEGLTAESARGLEMLLARMEHGMAS